MKKYYTPEIVALTLEAVDVIETSGQLAAAEAIENVDGVLADAKRVEENIGSMSTQWSW